MVSAESELRAAGIRSQRDFRQWARANHPDKGGTLDRFQHVSRLVDQVFGTEPARAASGASGSSRTGSPASASSYGYGFGRGPSTAAQNNNSSESETPVFDMGGAWNRVRAVTGRFDVPAYLTLAAGLRDFRLHSLGVDVVGTSAGRALRLPVAPPPPQQGDGGLSPVWLSLADDVRKGDAAMNVRLGVSHKLVGVRLRHELEGTVGRKDPSDSLPRVLSAGVNMQLPSALSFLTLHVGGSPSLRNGVRQAATIQDLEGTWVASLRAKAGPVFAEAGWRSRELPWERSAWEHHALGGAGSNQGSGGFPVLTVGFSAVEIGPGKKGLSLLGWRPFKKRSQDEGRRGYMSQYGRRRSSSEPPPDPIASSSAIISHLVKRFMGER